MDAYVKKRKLYRQNKLTLYSVVIGKCTEATKNQLEVERSFEDIDKDLDVIKLIKLIKSIPYAYESNSCPFLYVHQAMKAFYASYHKTITSCDSYIY